MRWQSLSSLNLDQKNVYPLQQLHFHTEKPNAMLMFVLSVGDANVACRLSSWILCADNLCSAQPDAH